MSDSKKWTCVLCGRDKFSRPGQPHHCSGGYRKNFKRAARLKGIPNCFVETVSISDDAKPLTPLDRKQVNKKITELKDGRENDNPKVKLVSIMDVFRELGFDQGLKIFSSPEPPTAFETWWKNHDKTLSGKALAKAAFNEAIRQMNDDICT